MMKEAEQEENNEEKKKKIYKYLQPTFQGSRDHQVMEERRGEGTGGRER